MNIIYIFGLLDFLQWSTFFMGFTIAVLSIRSFVKNKEVAFGNTSFFVFAIMLIIKYIFVIIFRSHDAGSMDAIEANIINKFNLISNMYITSVITIIMIKNLYIHKKLEKKIKTGDKLWTQHYGKM
jgi:hypothetical protein